MQAANSQMNALFTRLLLAIAVLLGTLGCADYQLGAVKPSAYGGVDNVFVPPFKNNTQEPRLSALVANAVIKQMQVDGTYQISERHSADAILRGSIDRIYKRQLRGQRIDTLSSRELGLSLYVRWHLEDPKTGQRITNFEVQTEIEGVEETSALENPDPSDSESATRVVPGLVIGNTIQAVDNSFQVGERNAIAAAAEDAAKKLVSQMSEGW